MKMNVKKAQINKALKLAMDEHKWAKNMRRTFRASFTFYLNATIKDLPIMKFEIVTDLPKHYGVLNNIKEIKEVK